MMRCPPYTAGLHCVHVSSHMEHAKLIDSPMQKRAFCNAWWHTLHVAQGESGGKYGAPQHRKRNRDSGFEGVSGSGRGCQAP